MTIRHALGMAHHFLVKSEAAVGPILEQGKEFLNQAVHLLQKGYTLEDNVKDLIEKHGNLEAIPAAPEGTSEAFDLAAQLASAKEAIEKLASDLKAALDQAEKDWEAAAADKATLEALVTELKAENEALKNTPAAEPAAEAPAADSTPEPQGEGAPAQPQEQAPATEVVSEPAQASGAQETPASEAQAGA